MEAVNTPSVSVRGERAGRIHKMLSPKIAHQLSRGSPWETEKSKIRPVTTKSHGNKRKENKRKSIGLSGGRPGIHHYRSRILSETLQVCLAVTVRKRRQEERIRQIME